jgi:hypothetical protein
MGIEKIVKAGVQFAITTESKVLSFIDQEKEQLPRYKAIWTRMNRDLGPVQGAYAFAYVLYCRH